MDDGSEHMPGGKNCLSLPRVYSMCGLGVFVCVVGTRPHLADLPARSGPGIKTVDNDSPLNPGSRYGRRGWAFTVNKEQSVWWPIGLQPATYPLRLKDFKACVALSPLEPVRALFRNNAPLRLPVRQLTAVPYQTTPPYIGRVSTTAADGVPRGVAGRSQTIDVYGSPGAIASGGFRLSYGYDDGIGGSGQSSGSSSGSGIFTSCIPAEPALLTAGVVAAALSSANGFLSVVVTEDEPPFDNARRFVVTFNAPELGVGALGVVYPADDCEWLQCDDGEIGDCGESGVVVNRDASVAVQQGAIEVCLMIHHFGCIGVGIRQVVEEYGTGLRTVF